MRGTRPRTGGGATGSAAGDLHSRPLPCDRRTKGQEGGIVGMINRQRGLSAGLLVVFVLAVVVLATTAGGAGAKTDGASALPRSQTLYVSGKQWGPYTDFNPFRQGDYATGVLGLVYETLFRFDPLRDKCVPWLATNGRWSGNTCVVTRRNGGRCSDGRPTQPLS